MRASDAINYVVKLNINVIASMFSPSHVKCWRDKTKQKFSTNQSYLVIKMFFAF